MADEKKRKKKKTAAELFDQAKEMLANNLRGRREPLNWSQEQLADEAELHRTYVGNLERAEQNASLESIAKLAAVLDVEIWELLLPESKGGKKPTKKWKS